MSSTDEWDAAARAALAASEVPDRYWAIDELEDDRLYLQFEDGRWVARYYERDSSDIRLTENEGDAAIGHCVATTAVMFESTEARAAATGEWLTKTGRRRPQAGG